ncbi:MAG: hypothetical protein JSS83_25985 [Cyanobacteria bacterium SZAS LIN-3]|nr:hypothetical protein [Cyanobacteria bacterium SZAS LIN-3]
MSTTWFVDEVGGNDANSGLTFALRKKTLASAATAGAAAGDTIRVMGKQSTSSGINATFTNLSGAVTLASALTAGVYTSGTAWTASTNVTTTGAQAGKLGAASASNIAIAAAFTTGLVARITTAVNQNLSGFQQLSFWIKANAAVAASTLRLDLCSDNAGATPVDQFTLPALTANVWQAITIDKGANMGASINSIRLFALLDPGTVTITIDDVIACKAASNAGCLTLNSLISSDNATWYGVKSIDSAGTAVRLDTGGAASAQSAVGIWSGTTGSVALSILNPLTRSSGGVGGTAITDTFNNSGSAGNPITISGGWDSAAMTTQNGLSVFDAQLSGSTGLTLGGDFVTVDHCVFTKFTTAIALNGTTKKGYTLSSCQFPNNATFFTLPSRAMTLNGVNITNSIGGLAIPLSTNYNTDGLAYNLGFVKLIGNTSGDGISVPANIGSPAPVIHDCSVMGNTTAGANGFNIQSPCVFYNNTSNDNPGGTTSNGFYFQNANGIVATNLQARNNSGGQVQINNATVEIYGLDTNFNLGTQVKFVSGSEGQAIIYDWTQNGTATKYSLGDPATGETSGNAIMAHREGAVAANNSIYSDYGVVTTTGVVGQSGSGIGWKLSPSANAFATSPLRLNVGKIACPANVTTYITYWAKFSAAGPSGQLRIYGGRYPGVGSPGTDVTAAVSGTSWAQYTLSFTPTEACVVDIFAESWGSSTQSMSVSGPIVVSQ